MDRLLSVSQAARMAGVTRKILQQHIQQGRVSTFEGYIRMSELHKAFPEVSGDKSGMIEKMQLIQNAAIHKDASEHRHDPTRLAADLHRAQIEIARLQGQVDSYRELAAETEDQLINLQEQCERREASMLGALIGWYMNQVKLREQ
jgi:chromosome segregation ATPase